MQPASSRMLSHMLCNHPCIQETPSVSPLDITILPKAKQSRKRKPNPAFAARHTICSHSNPTDPVQTNRQSKKGKTRRMRAAPPETKMATAIGRALVSIWRTGCKDAHNHLTFTILITPIPAKRLDKHSPGSGCHHPGLFPPLA